MNRKTQKNKFLISKTFIDKLTKVCILFYQLQVFPTLNEKHNYIHFLLVGPANNTEYEDLLDYVSKLATYDT